jgi:hypothetical protein
MYACILQIGTGFFGGVCDKEDRYPLLKTHPHPAIRGWFYIGAACPVVLGAANVYSFLRYLVPSKRP